MLVKPANLFYRRGVVLLLLLSAALLLWQHYGMNRLLRITPASGYSFLHWDDRSEGGQSVVTPLDATKDFGFLCQINAGYEWPWCELRVTVGTDARGLDLSGYSHIGFHMQHRGPGSRRLRIFLHNYHPEYVEKGLHSSYKVNELQVIAPANGVLDAEFTLDHFSVANWWVLEHNIPPEHARRDLHHVVELTVATAGTAEPGQHRVDIRAIEFRGKWLSREQVALGIIALWLFSAIFYLFNELRKDRQHLFAMKQRELHLQARSELLEKESQRLEQLVGRDPLTTLRNRATAQLDMAREAAHAKESGRPLSVMFIDIDHFKRINDQFGHDVGDQVLVTFAQALNAATRAQDYVYRWGGEEFVLCCPATNLTQAVGLADKLRQRITQTAFPHGQALTASMGIAECVEGDWHAAIRQADQALYDAKQGGRDRYVVFSALVEGPR